MQRSLALPSPLLDLLRLIRAASGMLSRVQIEKANHKDSSKVQVPGTLTRLVIPPSRYRSAGLLIFTMVVTVRGRPREWCQCGVALAASLVSGCLALHIR